MDTAQSYEKKEITSKGGLAVFKYMFSDYPGLDAIITSLENNLNKLKTSIPIKKRIIGMVIELIQNFKHQSVPDLVSQTSYLPYLSITYKAGTYMIQSTNIVALPETKPLSRRLEALNSYNLNELNVLYRARLLHSNQTHDSTGLGLIDIIRKAGNPISFKFVPFSERHCIFTLQAILS
jgi:hypothetical protein